ncbi:MAG TPA: hemolysin family protein [Terriglobales bacterium]|nr:hemolysin family protein [Terriglobales bacterium]
MNVALGFGLLLLLALLALVSYVERIYTEAGKFLSREFQENIEAFQHRVEPRLHVSRDRSALSMAVLEQLTTAAIAVLVAYGVFNRSIWRVEEVAQAAAEIIVFIIVFNRVIPYVLFSRTRGDWLAHFTVIVRTLIYLVFPLTLIIGFCQSVASITREHAQPEPEHPSEAVDALIEAGQEEGILEEGDRDLIQSVVEFGDKTVREVMKPRPEVFAVSADTTIEQFTEMLRTRPYSRIPVYEGSIDHIIGIVHAHDVLQVADTDARFRTVRSIMKSDVRFVPESKRVSDLLREMQRDNVRLEIVIDEYGAVAGVVTIEDMVEEIVGEIPDEHEAKADPMKEPSGAWVVPGNMDVDRLDGMFGFRLEDREATTVAGLVSEIAGRIPRSGEVVTDDGLKFEVLDSTDRKILRLRITQAQPAPEQQLKLNIQ